MSNGSTCEGNGGTMYSAQKPPHLVAQWQRIGGDNQWLALSDRVELAAGEVERDPDAAALLLDGQMERMLAVWYLAQGWPAPGRDELLADLDERAPELARRVRLALRAPDVSARLAHCRQVLALLSQSLASDIAAVEHSQCAHVCAREIERLSASRAEGWQAKGGVSHGH